MRVERERAVDCAIMSARVTDARVVSTKCIGSLCFSRLFKNVFVRILKFLKEESVIWYIWNCCRSEAASANETTERIVDEVLSFSSLNSNLA